MSEQQAGTGTGTGTGVAVEAPEPPRTADGQVDWAALAGDGSTPKERAARGKRKLVRSLLFELGVPLGAYYTLLGVGAGPWWAIVLSSLTALPWLLYGLLRSRRLEPMPVFTLLLIVVGALLAAVTGSPRLLLVRDSWVFGVIGLWVLGTLLTRRPFMLGAGRSVVATKVGPAGADAWAGQWESSASFRRHLRVLTAVWGGGFLLDALVRVVFALSLPLGAVPLANTLQWLAVLGGLFLFHFRYVKRHGLVV